MKRDAFYSRFIALQAAIGVVLVVAGTVTFLITHRSGAFPAVLGVLNLVMALWNRSSPLVRLFADRVEIKLAPLAPLRLVSWSEIRALSRARHDVVHIETRKGKTIRIPLRSFKAQERETLYRALQAGVDGA